jgi:branched-chain amino acid transport system substrate-binding protein
MANDTRSILMAVTLLAAAFYSCAAEEIAGETNLAIGLLLPPEEPEAGSLREGATIGVELANQMSGPRFRLIPRGRAGQWGSDGVEAARMVTDDGVQGLIAPPDGSASHLVLQVSGRTAVPVISLCADSSVSQTGVPWMARIVPGTVEEAKLLFDRVGAKHWAAVVADGRAGRETGQDLQEAATKSGCMIDNMTEVKLSNPNVGLTAKRLLGNHPAGILLWLDSRTAARMAKALRKAGFTGALAGPGRLQSVEFVKTAGEAAEGFVVPGLVVETETDAERQRFAAAYRRRFSHEPSQSAVMSYDAVVLLTAILRQAGGRSPHELFPVAGPLTGASGILAFDAQGNRRVNLQLYRVQNGCFVAVEPRKQIAHRDDE